MTTISVATTELSDLGVSVFTRNEAERMAIHNIDQAIYAAERHSLELLQRQLLAEIAHAQTADGLVSKTAIRLHHCKRRLCALQTAHAQLVDNSINADTGSSEQTNVASIINPCVSSTHASHIFDDLLMVTASDETTRERLIRIGELTPFDSFVEPSILVSTESSLANDLPESIGQVDSSDNLLVSNFELSLTTTLDNQVLPKESSSKEMRLRIPKKAKPIVSDNTITAPNTSTPDLVTISSSTANICPIVSAHQPYWSTTQPSKPLLTARKRPHDSNNVIDLCNSDDEVQENSNINVVNNGLLPTLVRVKRPLISANLKQSVQTNSSVVVTPEESERLFQQWLVENQPRRVTRSNVGVGREQVYNEQVDNVEDPMSSHIQRSSPNKSDYGDSKSSESLYSDSSDSDDIDEDEVLEVNEENVDLSINVDEGDNSNVAEAKVMLPDVELLDGLRIPGELHARLFRYQRTGLKWLWELHRQKTGGICGDEMGLGKTIMAAAFLASLCHSGFYRPSIIVCPGSVLRHWANELQRWASCLHVLLLHSSGDNSPSFEALIDTAFQSDSTPSTTKPFIIVTTYDSVRINQNILMRRKWGYVLLDEGHKIRNPDSAVTLAVKRFQTPHRIIMTGSPIQNNLKELWSLFDFVFPGKLGTLPLFEDEFCFPITRGGYSNASMVAVLLATKCATMLRDIISPYLLRRVKQDVQLILPAQSEQILFCRMLPRQRAIYREYLDSKEVRLVVARHTQRCDHNRLYDGANLSAFRVIDGLRKICNHPSLLFPERLAEYGDPSESGKMQVTQRVLEQWHTQGHRVLLFSQTRQMLNIIEAFVRQRGYVYRRLDGQTPIRRRQSMIDEFNDNSNIFLFLLTTKAGGVGINLIGANRVLLYDPDWNPSTDAQAKERVYRIGQQRQVLIYRLVTRGTIEEKIYQRQVFKQLLTQRVMRNPQQQRHFSASQLRDLFTFDEDDDVKTIGSPKSKSSVADASGMDSNMESGEISDNATGPLPNLTSEASLFSFFEHDRMLAPAEESTGPLRYHRFSSNSLSSHSDFVAAEEQRKIRALQASRDVIDRQSSIGVATWTGRSGMAGAPSGSSSSPTSFFKHELDHTGPDPESTHVNSYFGSTMAGFGTDSAAAGSIQPPSSASLLSSMRLRAHPLPKTPSSSPTAALNNHVAKPVGLSTAFSTTVPLSMQEKLVAYITRSCDVSGGVSSDQLIADFRLQLPTERHRHEFRSILRRVARLCEGRWHIIGESGT